MARIQANGSRGHHRFTLDVNQVSQNVNENKTNVNVFFYMDPIQNGWDWYYNNSDVFAWTVNVNGQLWSAANRNYDGKSRLMLLAVNIDIPHNADGSKSFFMAFDVVDKVGANYTPGNANANTTASLPTIPRATQPSTVSSASTGASIKISMPRASSSFTHTLTWKFYNSTGTIGTGLNDSTNWTIPRAFANQIPNATSGTCTLTCTTYSGSTVIGSKTTTFTVTVNAADIPVTGNISVVEGNSTVKNIFGNFRQNISTLNISFSPSGIYGSTIKSTSIIVTDPYGQRVGTSTGTTITINGLSAIGTYTVTATATDSRGRSATKQTNFVIFSYVSPMIGNQSAYRSDAAGTPQDDGTYLTVEYNLSVTAEGSNTGTYTVTYREKGQSGGTTIDSGTGTFISKKITVSDPISSDLAYVVTITLRDSFSSTTYSMEVQSTFSLIDFSAGGTGIAFGKAAETEKLFECALPSKFTEYAEFAHIMARSLTFSVPDFDRDLDVQGAVTGFYYVTSSAQNRPIGGQGFVLCLMRDNGGTGVQIWFGINNSGNYIRFTSSMGGWDGWRSL